jgi:hypothetical protein
MKVSFETDGFFSPQIEVFRRQVRETLPSKAWFEYALSLNRLSLNMLRNAEMAGIDRRQLVLNTHFVRLHKSFQSVLILAERGLVPDARVVLRSAVEVAIVIHALAGEAGFEERMIEEDHRSERTLARKTLDSFAASLSSGAIANLNSTIRAADAYEASKGKELTKINWEQVAERHCPQLYQFFYRDLSSDGTHATIKALERHLAGEEGGPMVGIMAGPLKSGLIDLLMHASLVLFLLPCNTRKQTGSPTP